MFQEKAAFAERKLSHGGGASIPVDGHNQLRCQTMLAVPISLGASGKGILI
jgi:hypothetical protein